MEAQESDQSSTSEKTERPSSPCDHVENTEKGDNDVSEYPEGGRQAWMVVLGAWCAMSPSMGLLNSMAVLAAWVSEHQLKDMSKSTIGWIFSGYSFFLLFCGAQIGPIFDAHDVRLLIIPGSIGITLALVLVSFSQEYYQFFLTFSVLGGVSASLLFNPSISTVGHWFYKRRGLATGAAFTAGGVGGVWIPLAFRYLAPRIGFAWTMRVIALICAVHVAVACCLLRKRLPSNKNASWSIDFKGLKDPKYATMAVGIVLTQFSIVIPNTYICLYGIYSGFSRENAYLLSAFLNAGAVPGRVLPGYLADRVGLVNTMCLTTLTCMALILGLWFSAAGGQAMTISFAVLFGFWSGASMSLAPVCVGRVVKTEDYGKRSGAAYTLASFGTCIAIPIAGSLLDGNNGSYEHLIIFSGVAYLASFLIYALGRILLGGRKLLAIC